MVSTHSRCPVCMTDQAAKSHHNFPAIVAGSRREAVWAPAYSRCWQSKTQIYVLVPTLGRAMSTAV
jgi:hypothetical protein